MRKYFAYSLFSLFLLVVLAQNEPAAAQNNLLRNPGFEGDFFAWGGINEIQVAHDWTPWWVEDGSHDPTWFRPEYKRALGAVYPNRVLEGSSAQQWFTFYASHLAGMYQQVFNVTPGQTYRFSIWAQVWSSIEDDPNVSEGPANPQLRIGIDPTGYWDPFSANVVWSGASSMSNHVDRWGLITVDAVAQESTITVFMRTNPDFANKHNDMYWDAASLVAVGAPAPPPTTTPAPVPPTNTPVPPPPATNTPNVPPATNTPVPPPPTNTPQLPPTATVEPPTATLLPATNTPLPTATVVPTTETPISAPTLPPTNTPDTLAEVQAAETGVPDSATDDESPPATEQAAADNSSSAQDSSVPGTTIVIAILVFIVVVLLIALVILLVRQRKMT